MLESETSSMGQTITTKPINDLPLNGRNFLQLAKLSMGVMEPKPGDRVKEGDTVLLSPPPPRTTRRRQGRARVSPVAT